MIERVNDAIPGMLTLALESLDMVCRSEVFVAGTFNEYKCLVNGQWINSPSVREVA